MSFDPIGVIARLLSSKNDMKVSTSYRLNSAEMRTHPSNGLMFATNLRHKKRVNRLHVSKKTKLRHRK